MWSRRSSKLGFCVVLLLLPVCCGGCALSLGLRDLPDLSTVAGVEEDCTEEGVVDVEGQDIEGTGEGTVCCNDGVSGLSLSTSQAGEGASRLHLELLGWTSGWRKDINCAYFQSFCVPPAEPLGRSLFFLCLTKLSLASLHLDL